MIFEQHHRVARSHPSLPGHFPGNPVVPAVVILDLVRQTVLRWRPDAVITSFPIGKFLVPLLPDTDFRVRLVEKSSGVLAFQCLSNDQILSKGTLTFSAPSEVE